MPKQHTIHEYLMHSRKRLFEASINKCKNPGYIYDTIYLAIIKAKRKYKKIINKECIVDICISLMKQPKKHVNQSFSSVEDCIEKALAAKVVPWKPIVSAVTIVLAAAIVVPFCLPKEPPVIDPKGFVMEGTQAFANRIANDDTVLQNYHELSTHGVHDPHLIANTEMTNGSKAGALEYYTITSTSGITFLVQAYVNAETKKAGFVLYQAIETGWLEVGTATIRYGVRTTLISQDGDTQWQTVFNIDPIHLLSDANGNIYVISCYNEGVQIHQYNTNREFKLLERIWMAEHKQITDDLGITFVTIPIFTDALYNHEKDSIEMVCRITQKLGEAPSYHTYFLSFDLNSNTFADPTYIGCLDSVHSIGNLTGDGENGFYLTGSEVSKSVEASQQYIYHINDDGNLIQSINFAIFVSSPTAKGISPYMLAYKNDQLHLILKNGLYVEHIIFQNDKEIHKYRINAVTSDSFDYVGFFFLNDSLYYTIAPSNRYIIVAKITDEKTEKIAEFELPLTFDTYYQTLLNGECLDASQGLINLVVGEVDLSVHPFNVVSSYFFQVVLE